MSGWKKQTILFGAAIFAFALFLAFTISGFVVSSKTSGFSLPEKNMKVISVQSEDDVSYISTDDLRLVCANGSEIQWEAALADRTSDVVVTSEYVVAGYVSERKVDVFDKENGEKLNTLEIPYPVLSLDADDANVYVAAKKGGLKGSEIYHFTDYAQEKEGVSLSLSNVILDVKIHPQSKVLYGVSTDYNIFTFENASGALVSERFASVPYEPLALGFSGGELIVADTTGYINVFSGNSLERSVNTGMTLCAFAANDTSETVVAANVSGKAAIVNVNTGKVTKISAPTEVQSISVSDSGVIALSEYRGFRTQFYDLDRIGTLLFFGWAKYVGLALTVLSIPVAVAGWFAVGDQAPRHPAKGTAPSESRISQELEELYIYPAHVRAFGSVHVRARGVGADPLVFRLRTRCVYPSRRLCKFRRRAQRPFLYGRHRQYAHLSGHRPYQGAWCPRCSSRNSFWRSIPKRRSIGCACSSISRAFCRALRYFSSGQRVFTAIWGF